MFPGQRCRVNSHECLRLFHVEHAMACRGRIRIDRRPVRSPNTTPRADRPRKFARGVTGPQPVLSRSGREGWPPRGESTRLGSSTGEGRPAAQVRSHQRCTVGAWPGRLPAPFRTSAFRTGRSVVASLPHDHPVVPLTRTGPVICVSSTAGLPVGHPTRDTDAPRAPALARPLHTQRHACSSPLHSVGQLAPAAGFTSAHRTSDSMYLPPSTTG
jgi:hypothetical protein